MENKEREKSFIAKYWYLFILFIVLIFLVYYCSKSKKANIVVGQSQITNDTLPPYFSLVSKLKPQLGDKACWAATLQMLYPDSTQFLPLNYHEAFPIRVRELDKKLAAYNNLSFVKNAEPSWKKIKKHLTEGKGLVTYKYFNETFAHVFLVKGYQESQNTQWLIVNDPWPVNKGKKTALAFNQFLRPHSGSDVYNKVYYYPSSSSSDSLMEMEFNIFGQSDLKEENQKKYVPPKVLIGLEKLQKNPKPSIESLSKDQINYFKNFDPDLYSQMDIEYVPNKDVLVQDFKNTTIVKEFFKEKSFLKYDLAKSGSSSYLFDGDLLFFVPIEKEKKPVIHLTLEFEDKVAEPYLYVSRFENYKNSEKAEWDLINEQFKLGLKNSKLKKYLNNLVSKSMLKGAPIKKQAALEVTNIVDEELKDLAILPVYGGMVYSFTYEPFDEKIVADPHKQLKVRPGQKALFVSPNGTPFYRLSAIAIPEREEILPRENKYEEEWDIKEQEGNIENTGIKIPIDPKIPNTGQTVPFTPKPNIPKPDFPKPDPTRPSPTTPKPNPTKPGPKIPGKDVDNKVSKEVLRPAVPKKPVDNTTNKISDIKTLLKKGAKK